MNRNYCNQKIKLNWLLRICLVEHLSLTFVMKNVTMLSSGGMKVSLTGFSLEEGGFLPPVPPITRFTSLSLCLSTSSIPSDL